MRTLVLGLGNPILGDDRVGWLATECVRELLAERADTGGIEIACCDEGGVGLMERMTGYDSAVLVDAMIGGATSPGQVRRFDLNEAGGTPFCQVTAHGVSLPTALALGRASGVRLPDSIVLIGVEAEAVDTFGGDLSFEVAAALPAVTQAVLDELARIRVERTVV